MEAATSAKLVSVSCRPMGGIGEPGSNQRQNGKWQLGIETCPGLSLFFFRLLRMAYKCGSKPGSNQRQSGKEEIKD